MAISVQELVGQVVREIRLARSLTQQQLANLCHMHRTFIVAIEKGRQNMSLLTLARIAEALKVLPAELFRDCTKRTMRALERHLAESER